MVAGSVPACDLKLDGADSVLKGMQGGLDGLYEVSSCESGLPTYKRKDSKPNGARGWCSQAPVLRQSAGPASAERRQAASCWLRVCADWSCAPEILRLDDSLCSTQVAAAAALGAGEAAEQGAEAGVLLQRGECSGTARSSGTGTSPTAACLSR